MSTADTTSELFRHQCEVLLCLRSGFEWTKEHIAGVKMKRGAAAAKRLWDDVRMQSRLGNKGAPGDWRQEPAEPPP